MVRHRALLVLALTLLSCSAKRPKRERKVENPENQALLIKVEAYIKCLEHSQRVFQLADLYRERFAATPPTIESDAPVQTSEDPELCLKGIKEAKALQPGVPELERAADAYSQALAAVFELTTTAHGYFDRRSPSFAPAKGIALHPKLIAAFAAFDATQLVLFDQVYQLNHQAHVTQLAGREKKDGRTLAVVSDDMMIRAEELVQLAGLAWNQLDKIDTAALAVGLGRFERSFEEFESTVLAGPQSQDVTKGYLAVKKPAATYAIVTRQLIARIRDKVTFSEADKIMLAARNEESVVGTPEAVVEAYNRLVDASFLLVMQ